MTIARTTVSKWSLQSADQWNTQTTVFLKDIKTAVTQIQAQQIKCQSYMSDNGYMITKRNATCSK